MYLKYTNVSRKRKILAECISTFFIFAKLGALLSHKQKVFAYNKLLLWSKKHGRREIVIEENEVVCRREGINVTVVLSLSLVEAWVSPPICQIVTRTMHNATNRNLLPLCS